MSGAHTPGPWRFEFNADHKNVHLVGGRPRYDLTIMDFERWGMGGATFRLRDTSHDGMNIMHKLHERSDWIAPEPGREHHKNWFQLVKHPDIAMIEAAPDLLAAAELVLAWYEAEDDHTKVPDFHERVEMCRESETALRAAIAKARGAA